MRSVRMIVLGVFLSGVLTSCAFQTRSFGPYSDAETSFKKGQYPKAIKKYQEFLNANPQGSLAAIAEYYIAKSYGALGDHERARKSFEKVMIDYPKTSWAEFSKEQLSVLHDSVK